MSQDFAQAFAEWQASNPLRTFRKIHALAQNRVAAGLGVAIGTVRVWEEGTGTPRPENMEAIADLMGFTLQSLQIAWAKWEGKKP